MDGGRIDKISAVPYYYQLEQLLQEKIDEMGKKGRQVLENRYTRKICTQKFKSAVEDVLQTT